MKNSNKTNLAIDPFDLKLLNDETFFTFFAACATKNVKKFFQRGTFPQSEKLGQDKASSNKWQGFTSLYLVQAFVQHFVSLKNSRIGGS